MTGRPLKPPSPEGAPRSPRVVVLEGPATAPLAEALRRLGEPVMIAGTLPQIERELAGGSPPAAVVLDLSSAATASHPARAGTAGAAVDPPAFVLAITPGGMRPDQAPLRVDVCVPADDGERALREVRGALAQRRLSAMQEELERLRSAVMHARRTAHDLAQPLTTIMARAQLLASRLGGDDPHARPIRIICEETQKLAALIEEFQKIKAIAAGPGSGQD